MHFVRINDSYHLKYWTKGNWRVLITTLDYHNVLGITPSCEYPTLTTSSSTIANSNISVACSIHTRRVTFSCSRTILKMLHLWLTYWCYSGLKWSPETVTQFARTKDIIVIIIWIYKNCTRKNKGKYSKQF